MTITSKLVRAVLIVSAQFATPAFAQAVIDEPGNYAFFHPNADVLNPSRPAGANPIDANPVDANPVDAMAAQLPGRNLGGLRLSVQPRHRHPAASAKPY